VQAAAERLELDRHRFVSLTGGEPLLQPEAVAELARAWDGRRPRILLETHGLAEVALARVVDLVDVVSMDWKLASDVRRAADSGRGPRSDFHAVHQAFLRRSLRSAQTVVKIVVTRTSQDEEIEEAVRCIAAVSPEVSLVLQPVTPFGPVRERPEAKRLLRLAALAEEHLADVRVIPQTHPIYGAP
jgi:pyruvate-formate lyase-activating enzyme